MDPYLELPFDERMNGYTYHNGGIVTNVNGVPVGGPEPKPSAEEIIRIKEQIRPTKVPEYHEGADNTHWYFIGGGLIVGIILLVAFNNGWIK